MRTLLATAAMIVFSSILIAKNAYSFSVGCMFGKICVQSQGTSIPIEKVESMLDSCERFLRNGIGLRAMQVSWTEVSRISGNDINHPLLSAYLAYGNLLDSPLEFPRRSTPPDIKYRQIAKSCSRLKQDYRY